MKRTALKEMTHPRGMTLPEQSIWDSVRTEKEVTRRSPFAWFLCEHPKTTTYQHTDHRNGPGGYSDSYEGVCCTQCGKVIQFVRVF